MREIKFRAKDHFGEWHYASDYEELTNFFKSLEDGCLYEDTVGQYIGKPDKHGTEICEGDKVLLYDDEIYICKVIWNIKTLSYEFEYIKKSHDTSHSMPIRVNSNSIEIIGTIHDEDTE